MDMMRIIGGWRLEMMGGLLVLVGGVKESGKGWDLD
jgi:hypothetical protein